MTRQTTYEELGQRVRELEKDVLKRKRIETALWESERRFKETAEILPLLLVEYDRNGIVTYVNPYGYKQTGYSPEHLKKGFHILRMVAPEEHEKHYKRIYRMMQGEKLPPIEYRLIKKDDSFFWALVTSSLVYDKGKVKGVRSCAIDISELKQTDALLKKSNERLSKINECFLKFVPHSQSNINRLTALCGRLLGATCALYNCLDNGNLYTLGQWNTPADYNPVDKPDGHICYDVIKNADDKLFVVRNLQNTHYAQTDPNVKSYRLQTYVGQAVKFADSYVGSLCAVFQKNYVPDKTDEELIGIIAAAIGVEEERRRSEEALRVSEERFRTIFEAAEDCIFIKDRELKYTLVNPYMERLFNLPSSKIIGQTDAKLFGEKTGSHIKQEDSRVLAGEIFSQETIKPVDGIPTTFHVIKVPLHNNSGAIDGLCGIARNITEIRRLECQLQQSQKMEAIGVLAGGIAHDFNNILSSIIGYTELSIEDVDKDTLLHSNLHEVLKAGNRARDLVQQILTFSRQADREQKPVHVKLMVKEALKLLRATIPSTIEIKQNIQSDAFVMGDSTQLHQVLMNLCANASHAMRNKGGVLTVDLTDVELDPEFISLHPGLIPGSYIDLTVTDTGDGIPPAVLEKIFDPFYTTKEQGDGTGLGLSVVHGIVHSHKGTIYAYSQAGKGSTFKVFLPAIDRLLPAEGKEEKAVPKGTERILLVDDEPAIVNMGKLTLEALGYDVTIRTSSIEALELFRENPAAFDLVITDMTIPQMTGKELAKELMQIRPDLPVILCSGFGSDTDAQSAQSMGIRAFVSKPVLKREIAETIREILDEKR